MNLTDEEKGEIYTYLAEIFNARNDFAGGYEYAMKVFNLKAKNETWIYPYSYFHAAYAQYSLGNFKKTKELLEKGEEYGDFDYKSKLTSLIDNLKSKI